MDVFGSNPYAIGLKPDIKINANNRHVSRKTEIKDSFYMTSPLKLCAQPAIEKMIAQSPEVRQILSENNIPARLNMQELENLINGHAKETAEISAGIARNLPPALRQQVDMYALKEGAILHDFGKVLIPPEILNKPNVLNSHEHKIMDLHSELGYQLLKNTSVNDEVLKLIRYHHNPFDTMPDINLQILNLADKYSALTEKRVYKDAFSPKSALTILYAEVKNGKINPAIYNALVMSEAAKELNLKAKHIM